MAESTHKNVLELKIPPLLVVLATAGLMWLVARIAPRFAFDFPPRNIFAVGFILAGMAISALGVVSFKRAGTTVNPMKPDSSSALVNTGIYKRTRNPMYLGFLLALIAWAIFSIELAVVRWSAAFYLLHESLPNWARGKSACRALRK